jgi:serine kinase of HPr protein (carbohydrate metabolism regulator)
MDDETVAVIHRNLFIAGQPGAGKSAQPCNLLDVYAELVADGWTVSVFDQKDGGRCDADPGR